MVQWCSEGFPLLLHLLLCTTHFLIPVLYRYNTTCMYYKCVHTYTHNISKDPSNPPLCSELLWFWLQVVSLFHCVLLVLLCVRQVWEKQGLEQQERNVSWRSSLSFSSLQRRDKHSPCLFISIPLSIRTLPLSATYLQPQSVSLSLSTQSHTHMHSNTHKCLNVILWSCQP